MERLISAICPIVASMISREKGYLLRIKSMSFSQEEARVLCHYSARLGNFYAFKYFASLWRPYHASHVHCVLRSAVLRDEYEYEEYGTEKCRFTKYFVNRLDYCKFFFNLTDLLFYVNNFSGAPFDFELPIKTHLRNALKRTLRDEYDRINPFEEGAIEKVRDVEEYYEKIVPFEERAKQEFNNDPFYRIKEMCLKGCEISSIVKEICDRYADKAYGDERFSADLLTIECEVNSSYHDYMVDDHVDYRDYVCFYNALTVGIIRSETKKAKGIERRRIRNRVRRQTKGKLNPFCDRGHQLKIKNC